MKINNIEKRNKQYGFEKLVISDKTDNTKVLANWGTAKKTQRIGGRQFGVRQYGMNSDIMATYFNLVEW